MQNQAPHVNIIESSFAAIRALSFEVSIYIVWSDFFPILLGRFAPGSSGWLDNACGPKFSVS